MKTKPNKERPFKFLRRGFLENVASSLIGLGILMFMQPFSMFMYSHSFKFILTGTLAFVIVSHFPE